MFNNKLKENIKSKLILGLLSLFMVFSMTSCMEKVDAGCEGIKVNLYGSDKGVDNVSLVTGAGWNPNECADYTHVFSLRGDNIVTKGLLKVKNLLCKKV